MPYCMYFHKGLALHGSADIPGYRASHGCVRMFTGDAKWLNQEWVVIGNEANHYVGTRVVIRPIVSGKILAVPQSASNAPLKSRRPAEPASNAWKDPDLAGDSAAQSLQ